jgi:hypothetical protein
VRSKFSHASSHLSALVPPRPIVRCRTGAIAYTDVSHPNSITSHVHLPSISSLLNSHPSPSSLTYHPSPWAFSLRFDFKLAERFVRVVLRCLSPTPPWILSLISVAHPFPPFPSSLLSTLPLGFTLRNLNCLRLPVLPSTFVHTLHRHLFPFPGGLSSSRISNFVLVRSPRTASLSV